MKGIPPGPHDVVNTWPGANCTVLISRIRVLHIYIQKLFCYDANFPRSATPLFIIVHYFTTAYLPSFDGFATTDG